MLEKKTGACSEAQVGMVWRWYTHTDVTGIKTSVSVGSKPPTQDTRVKKAVKGVKVTYIQQCKGVEDPTKKPVYDPTYGTGPGKQLNDSHTTYLWSKVTKETEDIVPTYKLYGSKHGTITVPEGTTSDEIEQLCPGNPACPPDPGPLPTEPGKLTPE